jgi:hypothetical protein
MNNLVVTLLQLLINVNVLDVEAGIVLEPLLGWPVLAVLGLAIRAHHSRNILHLDLLLNVIHRI